MAHYELREELDAALAQMPDPLRQAVILRYLEGHSQEEAARQAGCTQVTLGWRAMKGLERLRTILGWRGVVLAPAALLAVLTAEAQAATTLGLAAGTTGAASTTAAQLAKALVSWSLVGSVLRKTAIIALLATASISVGATAIFLPKLMTGVPASASPPQQPLPERQVQAPPLDIFDHSLDIGGPARAGGARLVAKTYSVEGGGADIYHRADQFRFVCRKWTGDGEITARVASELDQDARQVTAGVMFRSDLTPDSHHVALLMDALGGADVVCRNQERPDSFCDNLPAAGRGKHWIRLARHGKTFSAFLRADGAEEWKLVKTLDVPVNASLYVGLAVCAHDDTQLATATFDHVSLSR
jgi:hypothetical protein